MSPGPYGAQVENSASTSDGSWGQATSSVIRVWSHWLAIDNSGRLAQGSITF